MGFEDGADKYEVQGEKSKELRGQPGGAAVKCAHCTLAAWGSLVRIPGHDVDMTPLGKSHAVVGVPHVKWRKMGMDVSSGPVFLSKNRRIGSSYLRANLPPKRKKKKEESSKRKPLFLQRIRYLGKCIPFY